MNTFNIYASFFMFLSDAIAYETVLLYVYQKEKNSICSTFNGQGQMYFMWTWWMCVCACLCERLTAYKVAAYTYRIFVWTSSYCQGTIKFSGRHEKHAKFMIQSNFSKLIKIQVFTCALIIFQSVEFYVVRNSLKWLIQNVGCLFVIFQIIWCKCADTHVHSSRCCLYISTHFFFFHFLLLFRLALITANIESF